MGPKSSKLNAGKSAKVNNRQEKPTETQRQENFSPITKIQSEIVAEICQYLTTNDLFALSQVCYSLRNLLCSTESSIAQAIWRHSRLNFMPSLILPPPDGVSEKEYIELGSFDRGCQLCKRKDKEIKIIWTFRVRTCEACFLMNTMSGRDLTPLNYIPHHIYSYIPSTREDWYGQKLPSQSVAPILRSHPLFNDRLYWLPDFERKVEEWKNIDSVQGRRQWEMFQRIKFLDIVRDANLREKKSAEMNGAKLELVTKFEDREAQLRIANDYLKNFLSNLQKRTLGELSAVVQPTKLIKAHDQTMIQSRNIIV
ncbi:hypothetical protein G9A89_002255 [Geosiphon pyriformis]|nr:hypothetical protein G9A89_002255 [Geosiphon pyriformis]